MTEVPIKIRFSKSLNNLLPSRLIVVKPDNASDFQLYITDKSGNPFPLKDEGGVINSIINTDNNLVITGTEDKTINISPALLSIINSALQSGDNISELTNDAGYITSVDLPTKTSELINDGSDATSTYVEADELGAVAFSNDYNDLDNLPTIITNHSGLNLDDGTNPHNTTKSDVGLSNVDNTSDVDKPISTVTQNALNLKENLSNKATDFSVINDTLYPTIQAVDNEKISKSTGTTYTTNAILTLTQAEYDAIITKDPNTIYFIV